MTDISRLPRYSWSSEDRQRMLDLLQTILPEGSGFIKEQPGNVLRRNLKFWVGAQADYEALPTLDPETLYFTTA